MRVRKLVRRTSRGGTIAALGSPGVRRPPPQGPGADAVEPAGPQAGPQDPRGLQAAAPKARLTLLPPKAKELLRTTRQRRWRSEVATQMPRRASTGSAPRLAGIHPC